ncbi:MAG: PepSY domain-containing protein, partial [Anaerovoracaceae bacterium]
GTGNGNHHRNGVTDIGMDQAVAIAVARVPGATEADLKEIEREIDGGRIEYEGSIWYGGYEYEFEIDGSTGNILQWEIDD